MIWQSALLIAFGYLLGSIPTSYLAGRLVRNIDLRQYGSGTVSGSMVYEHVGRWIVVPVGLFDIAKGAFPAWLGLQLGLGEFASLAAGTAAVIGHNWPVYLRFTGGRGLSPYMGMMLVIFPWGTAWLLGFLAIGFLLGVFPGTGFFQELCNMGNFVFIDRAFQPSPGELAILLQSE